MSNEIVSRLLKSRTSVRLKESMSLFEAEADEEYKALNDEDEENVDDIPEEDTEDIEDEELDQEDTGIEDDSTAPEQGTPDSAPPSSGSAPSFDAPENDEVPEEEVEEAPPQKDENIKEYDNPLDNQYAVHYTLGDEVSLSYEGDTTQESRDGVVDGYDTEGFYRVKWNDGTTTNGLTDIALEELVKTVKECVCGSSNFINEGKYTVCDRCGRRIRENARLVVLDKEKGKSQKIRPELHPISTKLAESTSDSGYAVRYTYEGDSLSSYEGTAIVRASNEDEAEYIASKNLPDAWNFRVDTTVGDRGYINSIQGWLDSHPHSNYAVFESTQKPSLKEAIKNLITGSKINEDYDEDEDNDGSVFDRLEKELGNEFWTRQNELVDSIEELGYTVEEVNGEYVVVTHPDEEDDAYQIFLGGTARTMTLDFRRARIV